MSANNTTIFAGVPAVRDCCERHPSGRLIKAQGNCLGCGILAKVPALAEVLKTDGLGSLEYDDTQRPDGSAQRLRELIAERERADASRVVLMGSGLDGIPTLAAALGVETIARVEGDFPGYDRHSQLRNRASVVIPVDPKTRVLQPTAVADAVRGLGHAMLCLTFPATNPMQTLISRAHVVAAVEANPDIIVLADGAYRQFGDFRQLARLADEFPQVIYLQVASKDLFLPGARISWLVPSRRHAASVEKARLPYPLNTVAIDQTVALLERPDLLDEMRHEQIQARNLLSRALRCLGLPMITGLCPWVLLKWPADAKNLVAELEHRFGVLVQQQTVAPLDGTWVRISATVTDEAEHIVEAISVLAAERL